jgi:hypothetical protein
MQKSIKNVKEKSFFFEDFTVSLEDEETFIALKNPKSEFSQKNIIAIPNFLIQAFTQLESTNPFSIA